MKVFAVTALAYAFFVSLVALLSTVNLGMICLVMGVLAFLATALLGRQLLQAPRARAMSRWYAIPILISLGVYGWQLVEGVRLLPQAADTATVGVLAVVVIVSYAMGLWCGWDLLGGHRFYLLGRVSCRTRARKRNSRRAPHFIHRDVAGTTSRVARHERNTTGRRM